MAKSTGNRRTKTQRTANREAIARLTLQGWSQPDISQYLEISQATVCRDLKAIQQEWKESATRNFDLDRQRELERLSMLEKQYWEAWGRSQEAREISTNDKFLTAKTPEGVPVGRVKVGTRSEQRVGDAIFLNGVVRCVELRAKLLGLFPSEKTGGGSAIAFTDNQVSVLATLMKEAEHD